MAVAAEVVWAGRGTPLVMVNARGELSCRLTGRCRALSIKMAPDETPTSRGSHPPDLVVGIILLATGRARTRHLRIVAAIEQAILAGRTLPHDASARMTEPLKRQTRAARREGGSNSRTTSGCNLGKGSSHISQARW